VNPDARRKPRRAVQHGKALLDSLDTVRDALLSGVLSGEKLSIRRINFDQLVTRAGYTVGVFVLLSPAQCRLLAHARVATVQRRRLRASST
jgi:hypothetical protein